MAFFISNFKNFIKFIFQELILALCLFRVDLFFFELFFDFRRLNFPNFTGFDKFVGKESLILINKFILFITNAYSKFFFKYRYYKELYLSFDKGEFSEEFTLQLEESTKRSLKKGTIKKNFKKTKLASVNSNLLALKKLLLSF